jgi:CDP-glycerol glycerophosphotransferase (TagB/SpsB family)
VPETTTTFLKKNHPSDRPKLIFFPHGAGDRSIGFSPEISLFDYVLLPGEKTRHRMLEAGVIRPDNHRIVGYPKFEAYVSRPPVKLFDNDKPTVLYNPHFDPLLSSWFRFGEQILDYFADQTDYNLIFAPHVMLFQRKLLASVEHRLLKFRQRIDPRYAALDHIHIDTGSTRSVDMTYTSAADIYLGDVSSQIYEYIQKPRPALFLNSHDAEWQGNANYEHWNFGPVLDDIADLGPTLKAVSPLSDSFRAAQTRAFAHSFDMDSREAPSQRAALAIAEFLALP